MYSGGLYEVEMLQKRITVDQLNQVGVYAQGLQSAKYVAISAFTMVLWHWATHLDQEIRHFWRGPWTLTRGLFLVNRYLSPVSFTFSLIVNFYPNPGEQFCTSWSRWYPGSMYLQVVFGEFVLLLRVMALYPRSIFIRAFVAVMYLASIGISIGLFTTILKIKVVMNPLPDIFTGCLAGSAPDNYWALYVPSLIFETLLFVLTIIKIRKTHANEQSAPILNVLLRDGTFVFLASAAALLFSSIGSLFTLTVIAASKSSFLAAVSCVGCSHLLLSIKELQLSHEGDPPAALRLSRFYHAKQFVDGNTTFVNLEVRDETTRGRGFELSHVGRWEKRISETFPIDEEVEERWEMGEVAKGQEPTASERDSGSPVTLEAP